MKSAFGYLRLMRPANIITAIADILLGFAASGAAVYLYSGQEGQISQSLINNLILLILSTIGLYGGGVVFNDVFDAELDRLERPERPIPSGLISLWNAGLLGALLLTIGVTAAFFVNLQCAAIAITIATLALVYDAFSKHHPFFGPLNMGACRGFNVLLGISIIPEALNSLWFLAFIPITYIGAITMISQGEVHGGNNTNLKIAIVLYTVVIVYICFLALVPDFRIWDTLPFLFFFCYIIFPPLLKAHKSPVPANIRKAVKAGIIALIVMDASIASGFAGWQLGILILILLPISIYIGKKFAVT
ncbi:MAG: UbiA-like protein EboC [Bacteroidota bacterium]|nr:UbiA-like protein EboC [Bacteroidota bacterium]